jgi:hydrogenase maturation factor
VQRTTVCVTRVAKVVSVAGDKAVARFADRGETREIDVSMVDAKPGGYIEVFAEQATSVLTAEEAGLRAELWMELRKRLEAPPAASKRSRKA